MPNNLDPDVVLPLVDPPIGALASERFVEGYGRGRSDQQAADLRRIEPLIEALGAIARFQLHRSDTPAIGLEGCQKLAQQALASLGVKA